MFKDSHSAIAQQLALAIQLNDAATLQDFCWNSNPLLQHRLMDLKHERQIYLWGETGIGKSHLLQACCQTSSSAIYLPLKLLHEWGPEVLEGIEMHALISIDDIEVIANHQQWEEALFHLYNRVRDNEQSTLLISGRTAPPQLNLQLADLRSRIGWGLVIQVAELADEDKITTLQLHAHRRGLELSDAVGQFLLNRCGRNMHELKGILDHLDKASWQAQRKITIPFIKNVLGV